MVLNGMCGVPPKRSTASVFRWVKHALSAAASVVSR